MPQSPAPKTPAPRSYVISPEADRRLIRISLLYGGISFVLLLLLTFAVPYANVRFPLPPVPKAILNWGSLLIVLLPFLAGVTRMNAVRLEIGRERVGARAWTEAVAALEPFDAPWQRFLDGTGEAHFLLGQAYAGLGDKVKAERARAFVRRKAGSPWAEKLQSPKGPSIAASRAKVYPAKGESGGENGTGQEKRPTPPKSKPRRRF